MATTGFTHTVGVTYKNDAGTITSTTDSYVDDAEINVDEAILNAAVNQQINVALTIANLKSMVLFSDQNLTLKTNNASPGQDVINLVAGKQIVWNVDHIEAKPFSGNVTAFFVTNSSGKTANLKFRALVHQAV